MAAALVYRSWTRLLPLGGSFFANHLPQLLRCLNNALRLLAKQRGKGLFGGHQAAEQVERHRGKYIGSVPGWRDPELLDVFSAFQRCGKASGRGPIGRRDRHAVAPDSAFSI
jgi:hypothetical protein